MIMIVSDYDGTLLNNKNAKQKLILNVEAIDEFRKKSNLFVIATERNYSSIKQEIQTYNIPYDYLICSNGSVVMNHNGIILNKQIIDEKIIKDVLTYLHFIEVEYPILYDAYGKVCSVKNVVELSIVLHSADKLRKLRNFLNGKYEDIQLDRRYNQIILRNKCFKDYGIDYICSILQDKPEIIYAIGNDKNDLSMLKKFEGYLMYDAYLRDGGLKKCSSVKQLIKKII